MQRKISFKLPMLLFALGVLAIWGSMMGYERAKSTYNKASSYSITDSATPVDEEDATSSPYNSPVDMFDLFVFLDSISSDEPITYSYLEDKNLIEVAFKKVKNPNLKTVLLGQFSETNTLYMEDLEETKYLIGEYPNPTLIELDETGTTYYCHTKLTLAINKYKERSVNTQVYEL